MRTIFNTLPFCVILGLTTVGCSRPAPGPEFFDTSNLQSLEVLRLRPFGDDGTHDVNTEPAADRFHGWRIIDRETVTNHRTQRELSQLLGQGIREGEEVGMVAACYEPRHAIIARGPDLTCEVEICFECSRVRIYQDGKVSERMTSYAPMELLEEVLGPAPVVRRKAVE